MFSFLMLFVSSGTPSEFHASNAQSTNVIENNTDTNTDAAPATGSAPNTTASGSFDPSN